MLNKVHSLILNAMSSDESQPRDEDRIDHILKLELTAPVGMSQCWRCEERCSGRTDSWQ